MPTLIPFKEAAAKHAAKTVIGSDFSASQWADVPVGLRDRSIFSARITNLQHVQKLKDTVDSLLNPVQVRRADRVTASNPEGFATQGLDLATARLRLKDYLRSISYDPGAAAGGLQDLSSDARINLQLRQNTEKAQGFGSWLQGQAPGALDEFPAQELFRAEERKEPRNWPTRWMQAGGQIFGGRMIALKNDPIWIAISEFDDPYPPFDYNSGMWVRDIDRAEAIDIGLMQEGDAVEPVVEDFNARLEASVKDISPELQAALQEGFGDQIVIEDGRARWAAGGVVPPLPKPAPQPVPVPTPAPTPTVRQPNQKDAPDLSDIVPQHEATELVPAERSKVIEEARRRLAVVDPEPLPLTMLTTTPAIKKTARLGAEIVSRYVAPELLQNTKVGVKANRGREFCSWSGAININSNTSVSTAAHEIVHAVEMQNPGLLRASAEFLLRRGAGQTPQSLRVLTGNPGYRADEVAFDDDWKTRNGSAYAGKTYTHGNRQPTKPEDIKSTEVLTMGIERLHADPIEFFKNDLDWYTFTVKALRNLV